MCLWLWRLHQMDTEVTAVCLQKSGNISANSSHCLFGLLPQGDEPRSRCTECKNLRLKEASSEKTEVCFFLRADTETGFLIREKKEMGLSVECCYGDWKACEVYLWGLFLPQTAAAQWNSERLIHTGGEKSSSVNQFTRSSRISCFNDQNQSVLLNHHHILTAPCSESSEESWQTFGFPSLLKWRHICGRTPLKSVVVAVNSSPSAHKQKRCFWI